MDRYWVMHGAEGDWPPVAVDGPYETVDEARTSYEPREGVPAMVVRALERPGRELGEAGAVVELLEPQSADAKLRALSARGASVAEMAAAIGKGERTVYRALERLGLPSPARARPWEPGRSETVHVRCSVAERDDLDRRAAEAGLERSEYARRLLWPPAEPPPSVTIVRHPGPR